MFDDSCDYCGEPDIAQFHPYMIRRAHGYCLCKACAYRKRKYDSQKRKRYACMDSVPHLAETQKNLFSLYLIALTLWSEPHNAGLKGLHCKN